MISDKNPLVRALARRDCLSSDERALIEKWSSRIREVPDDTELVAEGSHPTESCLILEGFAARCKYLDEGKRQLTAVHIAGDFVDLHSLLLKVMDHSVITLSRCRVALVPHDVLQATTSTSPHLGRLLWLSTVIDAAIQRAWITCMGRRSAHAHLAHLICELYLRLETVGLAKENTFEFPATQTEIADMVGLSTVHANRMVQELRARNLITWQRTIVTIKHFAKLAELAQFDPTYLNLVNAPR
jgi:CRP-like cAMP-binding protein